jgi:hypothetical protein
MFEQPPRPLLVDASRLFIDVAATPPVQEGQWRSLQFIHIFTDRAYSRNRIPSDFQDFLFLILRDFFKLMHKVIGQLLNFVE